MICNVIGKECLEYGCRQYDEINGCYLRKRFAEFLYRPLDMMMLSTFCRFLEEIGDSYATHRPT